MTGSCECCSRDCDVVISPGWRHFIGVRDDERPLQHHAPEEGGVPGEGVEGDHAAHGVAVQEHRQPRPLPRPRPASLHQGAVPDHVLDTGTRDTRDTVTRATRGSLATWTYSSTLSTSTRRPSLRPWPCCAIYRNIPRCNICAVPWLGQMDAALSF